MGYIYIIENDITDKVYIGQTKTTIERRFKQHLQTSKLDISSDSKFYTAIKNIGEEHFIVRELEECEDDRLNEREIYYINKYDSFRNGYNSNKGGSRTTEYKYKEINGFKITKDELQTFINSGKSLSEIGRIVGISGNMVKRYCIKYGIKYNTIKNRNTSGLTLIENGNKMYFYTAIEAAEYIVKMGYSNSKNIESLAYTLAKSAKEHKKILGLYIDIGDTTNCDIEIERKKTYAEEHNVNTEGVTLELKDGSRLYFPKTVEAARYIMKQGYTNISREDHVSYRIGTAIKKSDTKDTKVFGLKVFKGKQL